MARIILTTYPMQGRSIVFALDGRPDPFPQRVVEIKRTADAIAARDAYVAEVRAATTQPVAVSVRIKDGDRKPAGFDAATRSPPYLVVNAPTGRWLVLMESDTFGEEVFAYENESAAREGVARLRDDANALQDGIVRTFTTRPETAADIP